MKQRVLSLLLILALAVCLLPLGAMAIMPTEPETLTSVSVTVTAPVAGAHPDFYPSTGGAAGYGVTGVSWYYSGGTLSASDVFATGVSYTVSMTFYATPGYRFDESTSVTINGRAGQDVDPGGDERIYASLSFSPAGADVWRVHFDPNGGGSGTWEWVEVNKGETLRLPECPYIAPEGMIFDHWDAGYPGDVIDVYHDLEIKALWKSATEVYWNVTFDPNGGTTFDGFWESVKVRVGESLTLPACPYTAPEGMVFDKWDVGYPGEAVAITADTIVKAQWRSATSDPTAIQSVKLAIEAPVAGMQSAGTARIVDEAYATAVRYTVSRVDWSYNPFDTRTEYVFEEGVAYSVQIMLSASGSFTFAEDVSGTINGKSATVRRFSDTLIGVSTTFPETASKTLPFTDVPADAWYAEDLRLAYATGLINGTSETTFEPTANITYAQAVTLAARMHQLYTTGAVTLTNGSPNWYDSYVSYAKEHDIITRDYDWNEPATRALFVEIFARALPAPAFPEINGVSDDQIPDVNMKHPQADSIYLFYRAGILTGYPTEGQAYGEFRPDNQITRAEVAAILTRMMYPDHRISVSAG